MEARFVLSVFFVLAATLQTAEAQLAAGSQGVRKACGYECADSRTRERIDAVSRRVRINSEERQQLNLRDKDLLARDPETLTMAEDVQDKLQSRRAPNSYDQGQPLTPPNMQSNIEPHPFDEDAGWQRGGDKPL